ncbi:MAG TPA: UDP-N-acetylglucosamine 2-epimerase (non-hydrolyzing) [Rhizomicrobium sp.]
MAHPRKLATILGARPQFVKAFALSRALAQVPEIEEVLIHTGQHYDQNMSAIFFDELQIPPPRYHFAVRATHQGAATAQMLVDVESALLIEKPDVVLIYGDTNSTLAGALAASKLHIPLAHVEAGMRSFNRKMAEEINRIVADHVSDILLCATQSSVEHLAREGVTGHVHLVGDLMVDATLYATGLAEQHSHILARLNLTPKSYAVATLHRAENTDDPEQLARAIDYIADQAREQPVVFPVHPRTSHAAAAAGINLERPNLIVIEPVGFLDMCQLTHHAAVVLTDSGGLQKEAYFHRVPCVTLRDETEWTETIECGWNRLWTQDKYLPRRHILDFTPGAGTRTANALRAELGV